MDPQWAGVVECLAGVRKSAHGRQLHEAGQHPVRVPMIRRLRSGAKRRGVVSDWADEPVDELAEPDAEADASSPRSVGSTGDAADAPADPADQADLTVPTVMVGPTTRSVSAAAGEQWPPLVLRSALGAGGYGTVYRATVGRRGPTVAAKAVPLIEEPDWAELTYRQPSTGASPLELVQHYDEWRKVMLRTARDALNNAALCEAAFYEMASDISANTGAPWFVQFHGAFRLGNLNLATSARTQPATRRPRARTAFIKSRRHAHKQIVSSFVERVPTILVCTAPCQVTVGDWILRVTGAVGPMVRGRRGEPDSAAQTTKPIPWGEIRALLAHAAAAVLFLKSIGLTHNDFHLGNLMLTPTAVEHVAVTDGATVWRLPTHRHLLQVVDYGLSTAVCPRSHNSRKRKRPRLLNRSSLTAIRYRRNDANVDMRTLLLDIATYFGRVVPGPDDDRSDPDYDAVCRCIELYCRADDDAENARPWLLELLDDRERLHAEVTEMNAEDDHSNSDEDELQGSLAGSLLAIRRVANSRRSGREQRAVPAARVTETFFDAFADERRDGDRVVTLPPL